MRLNILNKFEVTNRDDSEQLGVEWDFFCEYIHHSCGKSIYHGRDFERIKMIVLLIHDVRPRLYIIDLDITKWSRRLLNFFFSTATPTPQNRQCRVAGRPRDPGTGSTPSILHRDRHFIPLDPPKE
jgi:hypothetical protein